MFVPAEDPSAGADESSLGITLPPDLQAQVVRRLRVVAIVYAVAFLLADFLPPLVSGEFRERFEHLAGWGFGVTSIVFALATWAALGSGLPWGAKVILGQVFQVAGSFGIASAQYAGLQFVPVTSHMMHMLSPSWVGIWMVFYSVIVPLPTRVALVALLGSAMSVPVVLWLTLVPLGRADVLMPPIGFFFRHVFPYLICVGLAIAGGRVVFHLGAAIKRARELGSYRLIERLGRGGMGEVWRASHRMLARPAAIKFIRGDVGRGASHDGSRQALKRFELEAQATASLTSPHTVALYDYGSADDGRFFYVMELLDGLDLEAMVRHHGPLPPERVVHLVAQACESLEEAHVKGLVHRDIKPANIYACKSGCRYDFVKVLDFGLVARDRALAGDGARLTQADQATGTPAYMPPEIAAGKAIDGRADLYSLCCVAYWLLTGCQVFEGETVYDIVHQHLSATPVPPSRRLGAELPAALDAVIMRGLEKDPANRPAHARELARLLRTVPLAGAWDDDRARVWWEARATTPATAETSPA
jgi:serine/threonine-protein kinase